MWDIYFGEWKEGKLKRLAYLGYDVLLMVVGFAVIFGLVMFFGGLEEASGDAFADMFAGMGILIVVLLFLFFIVLFVASLNIMAKRVRDMGLPAWGTVVGIILVSMLLGLLFPLQQAATDIFNLIVFAAMVLIPSDTFEKKEETPEA